MEHGVMQLLTVFAMTAFRLTATVLSYRYCNNRIVSTTWYLYWNTPSTGVEDVSDVYDI